MKYFNLAFLLSILVLSLLAFSCNSENEYVDGDESEIDHTEDDIIDGDDSEIDYTEDDVIDGDDSEIDHTEDDIIDGDDSEIDHTEDDVIDGDDSEIDHTEDDVIDGDDSEIDYTEDDIIDGDEIEEDHEENDISALGSVSGHAIFNGETDHSNINVILLKNDSSIGMTETDQNGYYIFNELVPGNYTITANWGDFTRERNVATDVKVYTNQNTVAETLSLTPTGNIQGNITLDGATTDIIGVLIFIPGTSYIAITNNSGHYLLTYIPTGTYQLCAQTTGFEVNCLENIEVLAGQTITSETFNLTPDGGSDPTYAGLSGNVTLLGEEIHSGIKVSLSGTNISTTTDTNGNYALINVPPGIYDIVFDAPEDSNFEKGATLYDFTFFSSTHDNTISDLVLDYGENIAEIENLSGSDVSNIQNNMTLGQSLFVRYSDLIRFDKNTGLFEILASDVLCFRLNDDWSKGIFLTNSYQLFTLPLDGSDPVLLGEDVTNFYGSHDYKVIANTDWTKILYITNNGDIYSVSYSNGASFLLGIELDDNNFKINPDWSRIVFKNQSGVWYSANINDGTSFLIANNPQDITISTNFNKIVYITDKLYSISTSGGIPTVLSNDADNAIISPNSEIVVYSNSYYVQPHPTLYKDLYSIPIDGGTEVLLFENTYEDCQISPDSSKVVVMNTRSEISSVDITGGTPILLGKTGNQTLRIHITPDSSKVISFSHVVPRSLYQIPITGGTATILCEDLPDSESYTLTPDNTYAICRNTSNQLYTTSITESSLSTLGTVYTYDKYFITNDWTKIVFKDTSNSIFSASISGANLTLLAENAHISSVTEDSNRVLYYKNDTELFSSPITGGEASHIANDVKWGYFVSPDSSRLSVSTQKGNFRCNINGTSARYLTSNTHGKYDTRYLFADYSHAFYKRYFAAEAANYSGSTIRINFAAFE